MTPTNTPEVARLAEEAKRLARQLSSSAYSHGVADERDSWKQQEKYDKQARDQLAQLSASIDALAALAKQDAAPTIAARDLQPLIEGLVANAADSDNEGFFGVANLMRDAAHTIRHLSAPTSASTVPEWLPIETAPKDGKAIYVIVADAKVPEAGVAHWSNGTWRGDSAQDWEGASDPLGHFGIYPSPTHWMPLPIPPGACSVTDGEAKK